MSPAVDSRTSSTCPERCSEVDFQPWQEQTYYTVPHSTALATGSFQDSIQAVCLDAQHPSQQVFMLSVRHSATYHRHSNTFRSAFFLRHVKLHNTEAAYQIRRARFLFLRTSSMNSLPADLRTISRIPDFNQKLKHHLFRLTFEIL